VKIVYEDSDILVINKPPGLVIDRDRKPPGWEKFLVVHRLDKDTSGLLVLAKTVEAAENLKKQFKERKVKKGYLALVHGKVEPPSGTISRPIGRSPKGVGKFVALEGEHEGGREAVTEYKTNLHSGNDGRHPQSVNFTLLDVSPLTGRTHQIRVHLQAIGHPVVGDKLYASRKQQKEDAKIIKRQFLHAYRLGFEHPKSKEWLSFEADLPQDLKKVLEELT